MNEYGPMRICRQMIGIDSLGKAKIWINLNPVSPFPWNKCSSEKQMISDLMHCLDEPFIESPKKASVKSSFVKEYSSFK